MLAIACLLNLLLPAAEIQNHRWEDNELTVVPLRSVGFFDSEMVGFTIPVIALGIVTVLSGLLAARTLKKGPMIRVGILGIALAACVWFAGFEATTLHHPDASATASRLGGHLSGALALAIFILSVIALIVSRNLAPLILKTPPSR